VWTCERVERESACATCLRAGGVCGGRGCGRERAWAYEGNDVKERRTGWLGEPSACCGGDGAVDGGWEGGWCCSRRVKGGGDKEGARGDWLLPERD
jgi:hypothetical protein